MKKSLPRIQADERIANHAIELYKLGLSVRAIAEKLKSQGMVKSHTWVHRALNATKFHEIK